MTAYSPHFFLLLMLCECALVHTHPTWNFYIKFNQILSTELWHIGREGSGTKKMAPETATTVCYGTPTQMPGKIYEGGQWQHNIVKNGPKEELPSGSQHEGKVVSGNTQSSWAGEHKNTLSNHTSTLRKICWLHWYSSFLPLWKRQWTWGIQMLSIQSTDEIQTCLSSVQCLQMNPTTQGPKISISRLHHAGDDLFNNLISGHLE